MLYILYPDRQEDDDEFGEDRYTLDQLKAIIETAEESAIVLSDNRRVIAAYYPKMKEEWIYVH